MDAQAKITVLNRFFENAPQNSQSHFNSASQSRVSKFGEGRNYILHGFNPLFVTNRKWIRMWVCGGRLCIAYICVSLFHRTDRLSIAHSVTCIPFPWHIQKTYWTPRWLLATFLTTFPSACTAPNEINASVSHLRNVWFLHQMCGIGNCKHTSVEFEILLFTLPKPSLFCICVECNYPVLHL